MSAQNPPVDATSVNGAPVIVSPPQTVDDENHQMDDVQGSNETRHVEPKAPAVSSSSQIPPQSRDVLTRTQQVNLTNSKRLIPVIIQAKKQELLKDPILKKLAINIIDANHCTIYAHTKVIATYAVEQWKGKITPYDEYSAQTTLKFKTFDEPALKVALEGKFSHWTSTKKDSYRIGALRTDCPIEALSILANHTKLVHNVPVNTSSIRTPETLTDILDEYCILGLNSLDTTSSIEDELRVNNIVPLWINKRKHWRHAFVFVFKTQTMPEKMLYWKIEKANKNRQHAVSMQKRSKRGGARNGKKPSNTSASKQNNSASSSNKNVKSNSSDKSKAKHHSQQAVKTSNAPTSSNNPKGKQTVKQNNSSNKVVSKPPVSYSEAVSNSLPQSQSQLESTSTVTVDPTTLKMLESLNATIVAMQASLLQFQQNQENIMQVLNIMQRAFNFEIDPKMFTSTTEGTAFQSNGKEPINAPEPVTAEMFEKALQGATFGPQLQDTSLTAEELQFIMEQREAKASSFAVKRAAASNPSPTNEPHKKQSRRIIHSANNGSVSEQQQASSSSDSHMNQSDE